MKTPTKYILATLIILVLLISNLSCGLVTIEMKTPTDTQTPAGAVNTRLHAPVRTGELTLGPKVDVASQAIGKDGGGVVISKPGDPLDGFSLGVPLQTSATTMTFKVSYAAVTKQTFGDDFSPASPLITIDNGGVFSDQMMYLQVPVKIPEGYLAMGFLYDDKTKQLEGMPLIAQDAASVTVATRHFSNFLIGMIKQALLKETENSGFAPGIDDWQFTNYGSYIAPGGQCEGQSLSEMWYYCTQPDGKDLSLYGRYDNNGNQPATPSLWEDDSSGYRFVSTVHDDNSTFIVSDKGWAAYQTWSGIAGRAWKQVNNKWGWVDIPQLISDGTTRDLFAFAIQMTGEPQLIKVQDDSGSGGHTMVVYKTVGNALYIADPNYPGNTDRKVIYYSADGKFKPYNSGANKADIDAGKGTSYNHIMYFGKSTLVDWGTIAKRWAELKNKTIGNDKFPAYKIIYVDNSGQLKELTDGTVFSVNKVLLGADFSGTLGGVNIFKDGVALKYDADSKIELQPGNNLLGIYVTKKVGNDYLFVDFKYINVIFGALTIDPATLNGEINKDYTFTAKVNTAPAGSKYEWSVNGKVTQTSPSEKLTTRFPDEGTYTLSVRLLDKDNKEVAKAQSVTNIKKIGTVTTSSTPAQNISAMLQKTTHIRASVTTQATQDNTDNKTGTHSSAAGVFTIGAPFDALGDNYIPVTWSGTSFSGKSDYMVGDSSHRIHEITGTVSTDGKNVNFKYSYQRKDREGTPTVSTWTASFECSNVPLNVLNGSAGGGQTGIEAGKCLTKFDYRSTTSSEGKLWGDIKYINPTASDKSSITIALW